MKETNKSICGAKTRGGGVCQKLPGKSGRCHLHGDKSKKGAEHYNFKTGRHSKYLPDRLHSLVEELRTDKDFLNNREEILLIDARINQLLTTLEDDKIDVVSWATLRNLRDEILSYTRAGNKKKYQEALHMLLEVINEGSKDIPTWEHMISVIQKRDKLAASQHRRNIDASRMIAADKLLVLIETIIDIIASRVSNETEIQAIVGDIRNIFPPQVGGRA